MSRGVWEVSDLPARYRAQAEAQLARRPRRRPTVKVRSEVGRPLGEPEARQVQTAPVVLDLPVIPWSLNDERSGPWQEMAARTRETRSLVAAYVRPMGLGQFADRVTIKVTPQGVRHDPGNSLPCAKAAIDGIVDAGVLVDDSGRWIASITMCAPVPGKPGMHIEISPQGEV